MPMKRTGFKRKEPAQRTGVLRVAAVRKTATARAPRTRMKSTRPKMTPIRKSARGQDCTLMIPGVCNHNPETTVLCHSNQLADGKGLGLKAPDTAACFGCSACHDVLDGRRQLPGWMTRSQLDHVFDRAVTITHARLREKGIQV